MGNLFDFRSITHKFHNLKCKELGFSKIKETHIFWRKCRFLLTRPVFYLFNLSLSNCTFHDYWKVTFTAAIPKTGDSSQKCNYLPIRIIRTIPKLFVSFICELLTSLLRGQNNSAVLLVDLLSWTFSLLQIFCQSSWGGCIKYTLYTDFSKALDCVNHQLLVHKLRTVGVEDPLLRFNSRIVNVTSGVLQGSNLGSL